MKAQLVVGSPNRVTLTFPDGEAGKAILLTDMLTGNTRVLSVCDLVTLINE